MSRYTFHVQRQRPDGSWADMPGPLSDGGSAKSRAIHDSRDGERCRVVSRVVPEETVEWDSEWTRR